MSEPIQPAQPQEAPQEQPQADAPPWGDDFDPARAWHTIQTLREREKELSRKAMTPEQQAQFAEFQRQAEASKSEAQRQQEALEAANRGLEQARAEALRYRIAADHGIGREDLDLLGTGTEEQLLARAERIAALRAASQQPAPTPLPKRPSEQLQPGATPAGEKNEDDVLFERLFGASAQ